MTADWSASRHSNVKEFTAEDNYDREEIEEYAQAMKGVTRNGVTFDDNENFDEEELKVLLSDMFSDDGITDADLNTLVDAIMQEADRYNMVSAEQIMAVLDLDNGNSTPGIARAMDNENNNVESTTGEVTYEEAMEVANGYKEDPELSKEKLLEGLNIA